MAIKITAIRSSRGVGNATTAVVDAMSGYDEAIVTRRLKTSETRFDYGLKRSCLDTPPQRCLDNQIDVFTIELNLIFIVVIGQK